MAEQDQDQRLMIPLFITSEIPQKTLEELILAAEPETVDPEIGNVAWALVDGLSRDKLRIVEDGNLSLPESIDHSKGKKPHELIADWREHFQRKDEAPQDRYPYFTYGVLDEQSVRDKRVILVGDNWTGPQTEQQKRDFFKRVSEKYEKATGEKFVGEDEEEVKKGYGTAPNNREKSIAEDVSARRVRFDEALEIALSLEMGTGFLHNIYNGRE